MKLRHDIKDYLVAQEIWGSNTKEQCKIVKILREKGEIITMYVDDEKTIELNWSTICEKDKDDCGWLIPNIMLE
jgi:hypothetical protein